MPLTQLQRCKDMQAIDRWTAMAPLHATLSAVCPATYWNDKQNDFFNRWPLVSIFRCLFEIFCVRPATDNIETMFVCCLLVGVLDEKWEENSEQVESERQQKSAVNYLLRKTVLFSFVAKTRRKYYIKSIIECCGGANDESANLSFDSFLNFSDF